ncbi:MAG: hypothetical protein AB1656_07900 [Candidatus Omnitrophota bacterium]
MSIILLIFMQSMRGIKRFWIFKATFFAVILDRERPSGLFGSRAAFRLVREWIDIHVDELIEDWELARNGKELKKIAPLD